MRRRVRRSYLGGDLGSIRRPWISEEPEFLPAWVTGSRQMTEPA